MEIFLNNQYNNSSKRNCLKNPSPIQLKDFCFRIVVNGGLKWCLRNRQLKITVIQEGSFYLRVNITINVRCYNCRMGMAEKRRTIIMAKKTFSKEEIEKLQKNPGEGTVGTMLRRNH